MKGLGTFLAGLGVVGLLWVLHVLPNISAGLAFLAILAGFGFLQALPTQRLSGLSKMFLAYVAIAAGFPAVYHLARQDAPIITEALERQKLHQEHRSAERIRPTGTDAVAALRRFANRLEHTDEMDLAVRLEALANRFEENGRVDWEEALLETEQAATRLEALREWRETIKTAVIDGNEAPPQGFFEKLWAVPKRLVLWVLGLALVAAVVAGGLFSKTAPWKWVAPAVSLLALLFFVADPVVAAQEAAAKQPAASVGQAPVPREPRQVTIATVKLRGWDTPTEWVDLTPALSYPGWYTHFEGPGRRQFDGDIWVANDGEFRPFKRKIRFRGPLGKETRVILAEGG